MRGKMLVRKLTVKEVERFALLIKKRDEQEPEKIAHSIWQGVCCIGRKEQKAGIEFIL